ncbi:hypothetical protein LXA43DRAFT_1099591 [Ganoderma leucocontextum]|nr:hypothetical protein LXA43DRAFT_1099591 [Ganoderma leucocontextum]
MFVTANPDVGHLYDGSPVIRLYKRTAACEACFSRYCFTRGAMSGGNKSSLSAQPVSAGIVTGNLAVDLGTSSSNGTPDLSTLERNSYIIIGLLGGTILLLVGVVVILVRSRQTTREYATIREEKMAERNPLRHGERPWRERGVSGLSLDSLQDRRRIGAPLPTP